MHCPNCGSPLETGQTFCGACGAQIPEAQPTQQMPVAPPPGQSGQPPVTQPAQPTQQMPAQPPPAQPAQPTQQMPAAPAAAAGGATGSKSGLIAALSVVSVLLVVALGVGGYFAWRALRPAEEPAAPVETAEETATPAATETATAAEPVGFATPEAAVRNDLEPGWVFDILTNTDTMREYIIGPPNSEYTDVMRVEQQADGSWVVTEIYLYDTGSLDENALEPDAMSEEDIAIQVVGEFIYAIKQDRPNDAQALTTSPFSEDPASAAYSNGDLLEFEIIEAQPASGGYLVHAREQWRQGTEDWAYLVIDTPQGYRISELSPW